MRTQITQNQFWTALILAFLILAFSGQDILAQKKKTTQRKRTTTTKKTQPKIESQPEETSPESVENSVSPQTPTQNAESAATLQETAQWLVNAVSTFGRFKYLNLDNYYYGLGTHSEKMTGCEFTYTFHFWKTGQKGNSNSPKIIDLGLGLEAEFEDKYTIPLQSIDPLGLKVYKHESLGFFAVEINSVGFKDSIAQSRTYNWMPAKANTENAYESFSGEYHRQPTKEEKGPIVMNKPTVKIYVRDEESANRIAKAFKHAVKLCGGKVDPF